MANEIENVDEIDPLMDTGKAAKVAAQEAARACAMVQEALSQLQNVSAAIRQVQATQQKQERRASGWVRVWIEVKKFIGNVKNINIEE